MIDVSKLNDHSKQFAVLLFREYPQWLAHARFDPYEEFEREALLVEVPRPIDGSLHGLFITTSEWEISVGFGDNFHTRFGVVGDEGGERFQERALAFIRDFVDERVAVATASEGDEWLGAWIVPIGPDGPAPIEQEAGVTVRLRSWRGTWDRNMCREDC